MYMYERRSVGRQVFRFASIREPFYIGGVGVGGGHNAPGIARVRL